MRRNQRRTRGGRLTGQPLKVSTNHNWGWATMDSNTNMISCTWTWRKFHLRLGMFELISVDFLFINNSWCYECQWSFWQELLKDTLDNMEHLNLYMIGSQRQQPGSICFFDSWGSTLRRWRYPAGDWSFCITGFSGSPQRRGEVYNWLLKSLIFDQKSSRPQDDRPAESPPQRSTGTVTHWWHPHLQHPLTSSKLQAWWHVLNRKPLENP